MPGFSLAMLDEDLRPVAARHAGRARGPSPDVAALCFRRLLGRRDAELPRRLVSHRRHDAAGRRRPYLLRRPQRRHHHLRRATGSARSTSKAASSSIPRSPRSPSSASPTRSAPRSSRPSSCCAPARWLRDALKAELQQHVRTRLGLHAYPREIEFINELPKTPSGKVQRFLLRRRESAG